MIVVLVTMESKQVRMRNQDTSKIGWRKLDYLTHLSGPKYSVNAELFGLGAPAAAVGIQHSSRILPLILVITSSDGS